MDSKRHPHFFKVYFPKLNSERLKIPSNFLKHIEGETSGTFSLMGPSGKVWHVRFIETIEGFFFGDGWQVFVRDHFVEMGEFFVFRYDGNFHFTVQIFDRSGCDKESASYAMCSQDTSSIFKGKKRKRKEAVKVLNASLYKACEDLSKSRRGTAADAVNVSSYKAGEDTLWRNSRKKNRLPIEQTSFENSAGSSKINMKVPYYHVRSNCFTVNKAAEILEDSQYKALRGTSMKEGGKHYQQSVREYLLKKSSNSSERNPMQLHQVNYLRKKATKSTQATARTQPAYLMSQRRKVTVEETDRALKSANEFKSKCPCALMVMRISHVYYGFYLGLPNSFVKTYLPKVNKEIILWDPNGIAWPVSYVCGTNRGGLSGGWVTFAYGNNLEIDDVCVFELIKANEMRVHIFRVVQEIRPLIKNK